MANPAATNIKPLQPFHRISLPDQLAVQLKANRRTYAQISVELEAAYGLKRSTEAIRDWFRPSGRLSEALLQYQQLLATESLKEAELLLMRLTLPAVVTLGKLLDHPNPYVRLAAAKAIIDKTIPDANAVVSGRAVQKQCSIEPELPPELDEWLVVTAEVRMTTSRAADREIHRLTPKLAPILNEAIL